MPLPSAFKTDESFLEKLAMGATATQRTFADLRAAGHEPMELERGSTSFKIWKAIKIKRLRVPDVLCLRCGLRVESRGKRKLEITMSHSRSNAERAWDAGLDDGDLVALVSCDKSGPGPTDWRASELVQYIPVGAMKEAFRAGLVKEQAAKGVQEGSEVRVTWPASVSESAGGIDAVEPEAMLYHDATGRSRRIKLNRGRGVLRPTMPAGTAFVENQILASVVPVLPAPACGPPIPVGKYEELTRSVSLTDRYMAVKALGRLGDPAATSDLLERVRDEKEHVYVRLDAAAGLLRLGIDDGVRFFEDTLRNGHETHRLEAVIVLGEVASPEAARLLMVALGDVNQHPEIRGGAAWALGAVGDRVALPLLVESFVALDLQVRIEAARALAVLARKHLTDVVEALPSSAPDRRPGIAWALSKAGGVSIEQLLPALVDDDARHWVAYVLGTQEQVGMVAGVADLARHDPEVYFAVTVLWKILASWVDGLEEH